MDATMTNDPAKRRSAEILEHEREAECSPRCHLRSRAHKQCSQLLFLVLASQTIALTEEKTWQRTLEANGRLHQPARHM